MSSSDIQFVERSPRGEVPLRDVAVHLHARDNVAVAKTNLHPGTTLILEAD